MAVSTNGGIYVAKYVELYHYLRIKFLGTGAKINEERTIRRKIKHKKRQSVIIGYYGQVTLLCLCVFFYTVAHRCKYLRRNEVICYHMYLSVLSEF